MPTRSTLSGDMSGGRSKYSGTLHMREQNERSTADRTGRFTGTNPTSATMTCTRRDGRRSCRLVLTTLFFAAAEGDDVVDRFLPGLEGGAGAGDRLIGLDEPCHGSDRAPARRRWLTHQRRRNACLVGGDDRPDAAAIRAIEEMPEKPLLSRTSMGVPR